MWLYLCIMSAIFLHQFSDIWTVKSIYQINPNQYLSLINTIVSGSYSPERFYRDFEYNTLLVQEMIDESYSDINKITKLKSFLTYLNTEIPNTEREEFDDAFN